MTVGERLAQLLAEYGVPYVFGVPGGQTLPLYEGIRKTSGKVQHILMRDERSAGFAADAYARLTGIAGVCDATVGPGATNLVSPLAEAFCSSIPLIAIISDIPRHWEHRRVRGNASQAIEQLEIFRTISKWQVMLSEPSSLEAVLDTAFRVATTGKPGPVVLAIPDDVGPAQLQPEARTRTPGGAAFPRFRVAPDPESLARASEAILQSQKPVLYLGGGAHISGAYPEVRQLADHLEAPVITTISGKGLIEEDHPQVLGVAGSMGNPVANQVLEQADLVFFIGSKAGQLATFGYDFPKPGAKVIHLDLDPEEIGRNFPDSIALLADVKLALAQLLGALGAGRPRLQWKLSALKQALAAWYQEQVGPPRPEGEPLKPQAVMAEVNRALGEDDLAVCDASLASGWAAVHLRLKKAGRNYLAPRGLAGLGWGAPAAIGAALATGGERRILHFAGDGGFAYSASELEVMARLNLPVLTIVFNNATLAWIKHVQKNRYQGKYISTDFGPVDFATVAQGFGVRGFTARTLKELADYLVQARSLQGPSLIEVVSDQWETPVLRFASGGE